MLLLLIKKAGRSLLSQRFGCFLLEDIAPSSSWCTGHERLPLLAEPGSTDTPQDCAQQPPGTYPHHRVSCCRLCHRHNPHQPRGQHPHWRVCRGHWTSDQDGEVVATLCGVVEWVDKLVHLRPLKARYKAKVHDMIVGRVIQIAPECWRLEVNYKQHAVLKQKGRRSAVDELNMRSIFEENDVVYAEVHGFQHDGSPELEARSQKCGKLEMGQLLTVPSYLVKQQKQHFHHIVQYGVDLILGCNGYIWVGEHVTVSENTDTITNQEKRTEVENSCPVEARNHICRLANAVLVLSAQGFTLTAELIVETAEASSSSNIAVNDMLGAEFCVQIAEREAKHRADLLQ